MSDKSFTCVGSKNVTILFGGLSFEYDKLKLSIDDCLDTLVHVFLIP